MKIKINMLFSSALALICAGVIIYGIETERSFLQIIIGFAVFLIPLTFFSVFNSPVGVFFFVLKTSLITYITMKFNFYDFWLGAFMGVFIGLSLFLTKVRPFKPFHFSRNMNDDSDQINHNKF